MAAPMMFPFHLAFPVTDLQATEQFYVRGLGCAVGRRSSRWIDFDLFGHQLSAHLCSTPTTDAVVNAVDGDAVPIPHFGCVLNMDTWRALRERLDAYGFQFEIEPRIRFAGKPGEQATLFIRDPSGNALEFKAFADPTKLFVSQSD